MAGIGTCAIIKVCAYCNAVSCSIYRYRASKIIACTFPINVGSHLRPGIIGVLENSCMTGIGTCAIIFSSAYYNSIPECIKRERSSKPVINSFPIDIRSNLDPRVIAVFVNSYVASIIVMIISANCDSVTHGVHRNRAPKIIVC